MKKAAGAWHEGSSHEVLVISAITGHTLQCLCVGDSTYHEYYLHRPKLALMTAEQSARSALWMTVTESVQSQVLEGNNQLIDELEK